MKRERLVTCLIAAVLSAAVSFGAAGAFATAFDLEISGRGFLLPVCAGAAVMTAVLFSFRYGGAVLGCLAALGAGYALRRGTAAQLHSLLERIFEIYADAYGWNVLPVAQRGAAESLLWPVGVYAALAAAFVALAIVRRKSLWVCAPVVLLPLASIIVVTDTVPGEGYVLLLLMGLILLALTQDVRRDNPEQANRLTAMAALPVAAALTVVFVGIPQEDYVNQSGPYRDEILATVQSIPEKLEKRLSDAATQLLKAPPPDVELSQLGERDPSSRVVLEVTSDHGGTLYLRGQDYDCYDGREWTYSQGRTEEFGLASREFWMVTVTTMGEKAAVYLPYYPQIPQVLVDGAAQNQNGARSVTFLCTDLPEDWRITAFDPDAPQRMPEGMERYLLLPETTVPEARSLLEGRFAPGAGNTEKADSIAALVMECAQYNLNPEPVPEGTEDFALWFLQEAESGYCTHFATAATVLLRAAGVPARYVSGYMVDAVAGQTVTASEEDAHAWAEYYEPKLGCWIVLEATPASGLPPAPTERATQPTEAETLPPPTTLPQPTQIPEIPTHPVPVETAPPASGSDVPEPERKINLLPLLGLLLPVAAAILHRRIRLMLRSRRLRKGTPNERALNLWRCSCRLSRLLGEETPPELTELAEKAKYSNHTLTEEELQTFVTHNRRCIRLLKQKPWYRRLFDQYIRAAW